MSVSLATGEIALSCSADFKRLSIKSTETCADGPSMDNADFGEPLTIDNGNLFFKNNFLRIGFLVNCNWNEFVDPTVKKLKFNTDSNGNGGVTIFDNNVRWNVDATASRDQFTKTENRVIVHINVPTTMLYNITTIESIYVVCEYGYDGIFINAKKDVAGYWNLKSAGKQIYTAYKWVGTAIRNHGGSENQVNVGYFTTTSSSTLKPSLYYPASASFVSLQTNGKTNSTYFTASQGFIDATINLREYFSTYVDENHNKSSYYRVPYSLILKGTRDGHSVSNEIYIGTSTTSSSSTKLVQLNSEQYKQFSVIDAAAIRFYSGGPEIAITCNSSLKNGDAFEEREIILSQEGLINKLNEYVSHQRTTNDEKITLKTIFNGKLTCTADCPYEFYKTSSAKIVDANNNAKLEAKISIKNGEFFSSAEETYDFLKSTHNFNSRHLSQSTNYYLYCKMINRLKFPSGSRSDTSEFKDWHFIKLNSAKINVSNDSVLRYAAFGNPNPKIKYYDERTNAYYNVDGDIIIRDEELQFTNNFEIYNLNNGTKLNNISAHVKVDGSDIGYQISSNQYCSYLQLRKNNSEETDTKKITLSYLFKQNGTELTNTYSFPNEIILGRIVTLKPNEHYSIIKTQEGEIKYYLSDNGGDKDFPFSNTKLTSNQLIDLRKTGSVYFSLSRKPEEGSNLLAKEGLTISINDGAFKKTIFFTKDELSLNLLLELIELLYEGRTNIFSFFESEMFSDAEEETIKGLLTDKIKFSIELAYYYKIAGDLNNQKEDDRQNDVKTVVFSITENELSFLKSVEPIGLRKKGVIINPIRKENENEDLGNDNTFIINVNDLKVSARDENEKVTKWERQNGIKIVFHTDETDGEDADGKPIPIVLPTFEIYLGTDGFVHLSNCIIDGHTHQ